MELSEHQCIKYQNYIVNSIETGLFEQNSKLNSIWFSLVLKIKLKEILEEIKNIVDYCLLDISEFKAGFGGRTRIFLDLKLDNIDLMTQKMKLK
mgnify:CR=1 FL=1